MQPSRPPYREPPKQNLLSFFHVDASTTLKRKILFLHIWKQIDSLLEFISLLSSPRLSYENVFEGKNLFAHRNALAFWVERRTGKCGVESVIKMFAFSVRNLSSRRRWNYLMIVLCYEWLWSGILCQWERWKISCDGRLKKIFHNSRIQLVDGLTRDAWENVHIFSCSIFLCYFCIKRNAKQQQNLSFLCELIHVV